MTHAPIHRIGALAAVALIASIGHLSAGEPAPAPVAPPAPARDFFSGELHVGYNSQYNFRFVDLGQDLVETGVDLSFDLGSGWSLGAGAWFGSTNDSSTPFSAGSFNELDLTANIGVDLGWMTLETGYFFYHFPTLTATDSQELYLKSGFGLPWEIGFETTVFWDFQRYSGLYFDANLNRSFEITERLSLDLSVGVGFNDGNDLQVSFKNPGGTRDGYQGWYVVAAAPWKITDTLTLSPYVKFTDADSDLVTDSKGTSHGKRYIIGGASLSVSF